MSAEPELQAVLNRPAEQRRREYKYRFAQAVIFGLPVLGLQWFGRFLGGGEMEQQRWIAILQALLAGWITCVAATGMFIEGAMLLLQRQLKFEFLLATFCIGMFLFSLVSALGVFFIGRPFYSPLLFHWVVIVLAVWSGIRWGICPPRDSAPTR